MDATGLWTSVPGNIKMTHPTNVSQKGRVLTMIWGRHEEPGKFAGP